MLLNLKKLLWVPFSVMLIGLPAQAEPKYKDHYPQATDLKSRVLQLVGDRDRGDWGRWGRYRDRDYRWDRDRDDWKDRRDRRYYNRRYYPDYRYQYRYSYPSYRYNDYYYRYRNPYGYGNYYPYNYNYNYYPQGGGLGILGGLLRLW